jgi:hypothetical protein
MPVEEKPFSTFINFVRCYKKLTISILEDIPTEMERVVEFAVDFSRNAQGIYQKCI